MHSECEGRTIPPLESPTSVNLVTKERRVSGSLASHSALSRLSIHAFPSRSFLGRKCAPNVKEEPFVAQMSGSAGTYSQIETSLEK
jgi:hypothetical protein